MKDPFPWRNRVYIWTAEESWHRLSLVLFNWDII